MIDFAAFISVLSRVMIVELMGRRGSQWFFDPLFTMLSFFIYFSLCLRIS